MNKGFIMKDGYYLSTYLSINPIANLYNIGIRHDQNISLWKLVNNDVELIHYWELERLTGYKQHSVSFLDAYHAKEIISNLLMTYQLTLDDINEIWGTPELETNKSYISSEWEKYPIHSLAHLASSFFINTDMFENENILVIEVDGGPDSVIDNGAWKKDLFVAGYSQKHNNKIRLFPCLSPGVMWSEASNILGIREGTLMALAYASKSKMNDSDQYIDSFITKSRKEIKLKIINLHNYIWSLDESLFCDYDKRFTLEENRISIFMKIIQEASVKIMDINIDSCIHEFDIPVNETYLSITGGYALNCPTNSYLLKKYNFKGFISSPCVNDSGISLGIALLAFYNKQKLFRFSLKTAYWGNSEHEINDILNSKNFIHFIKNKSEYTDISFVNDIINGPVIWFDGKSEIGPRALGNRSVLGDPRNPKVKESLNTIKQREWWRPVAPIILNEYKNDWFENIIESPFMLLNFKIKTEKEKYIPSIIHLDKSSRVQTLCSEDNKLLYNAINAFYQRTKIPLLCNTSLNDKGEPIINTISEALNFALRKKINVCYFYGYRVELYNHCEYVEKDPLERKIDFKKYVTEEKKIKYMDEYNPLNLDVDILGPYYTMNFLYRKISIKDPENVKKIRKILRYILGE